MHRSFLIITIFAVFQAGAVWAQEPPAHLIQTCENKGDVSASVEACDKIITGDFSEDARWDGYFRKGMTLHNTDNREDEAIAAYSAAIDISLIENNDSNYEAGLKAAKQAVKPEADLSAFRLSKAYNNMGNAYRALDNFPASVSSLVAAIEHNPRNGGAYRNLARTHIRTKDLKAAEIAVAKAVEVDPGNQWNKFLSNDIAARK